MEIDALVVGAGFGGIYQLYRLLQLGLKCKVVDMAGGVGGTWYWNKYPGCMSDSWSLIYRFSWDKDDLLTYPWPNNYVMRDEILKYLNHVVDKHGLREHMQFNAEVSSAEWDNGRWKVTCRNGHVFSAKYLFTALGLLTRPKYPDIPGIADGTFQGELMHSASWDPTVDIRGKRVAVIGCGSTGIQITTAIADEVKELHCFIRHPQYSTPAGFRAVSTEERQKINETYDDVWNDAFNSNTAFGFSEGTKATMSVSAEERERIFEDLWQEGNSLNFMFSGFGDIVTNEEANEEACKFIRKKITHIVKDPAKASILTPHDLFVRRPPCDKGYYDKFNRDHVFAIDAKKSPIVSIEKTGLKTSDGKIHEVDIIVLATGFDAVDGSYNAISGGIKGRDGALLSQYWSSRPTAYLGVFVPKFPNLFLINGPQAVFSNQPTAVEIEVNLIMEILDEAKRRNTDVVEATAEAESQWIAKCDELASYTLFDKVRSWLTGANFNGKQHQTRFFYGGLKSYLNILEELRASGYGTLKFSQTEASEDEKLPSTLSLSEPGTRKDLTT